MSRKIALLPWLIISSVTQVVLSVGVVGYISYRNGQDTINHLAQELMIQGDDRLVNKIDHYLSIPDLINRLNEDSIQTGILNPEDLEAIHRQLILQHRQFNSVTSIVYGDTLGNFRLVNRISPSGRYGVEYAEIYPLEIGFNDPLNPGKLHFYNLDQLGIKGEYLYTLDVDVLNRPWYQQGVKTQQPGWTKPFEIGTTGILTINAYRPIFSQDNQELIGVFAVNISLEEISNFLREIPISDSSGIYIVDSNDYLIASSYLNLPYHLDILAQENSQVSTIEPTETTNHTLREVHHFLQSKFTNLDEIKSVQTLELTIDREKYFVRVIPYGSELGLDWLMVMIVPESDFTAENRANLQKTILLCFAAGALALLNSLVTSRWIVIPVLKLQKLSLNLPHNHEQNLINSPIQEIHQLGLIIKTTLTQLQNSESRLHQTLEYLPVGVVVLDANGTITYINPHGMKLLNIKRIQEAKEGEHSQVYQLFRAGTNDLYPYAELPSIQALQGKKVFVDDIEIRVNGKIIPCEVYSNPIFNHKQEIIGCVNACQDISDRLATQTILSDYNQTLATQVNEATETLRKNQTLLQRVLKKVPGNICAWISYPDGRIEYQFVNPLLSEIIEIDTEVLLYYPNVMWDIIHEEDHYNYQQAIAHSSATLELFDQEWRIISISGKTKWLQGILQPELGENGAIYWYGVILDITDRKQAEAELKESEEKFRSCFNYVATGMAMVDLQGNFLQVNSVFCEIMGYSVLELLQMNFKQLTHPDDLDNSVEHIAKVISGEVKSFQIEKRYLDKQQNIIYALTNVSLVKNSDDLPVYMVAQIQDISDRSLAQMELEKAKLAAEAANLAKTQFIAAISHELRTPMNAILGFTQLLLKKSTPSTTAQLKAILDNGNHLLSLINNLLTIAQIETGNFNLKLNQVNLCELLAQLHNSYALQAQTKGLELIWCTETEIPYYINTDEVKLRQILINVLDNALKFTPEGKIAFTVAQENNLLVFKIADTGAGIAPEEIQQLFQPFSQTKIGRNSQQGTGLGLAVTQQLLNYLQGEITVVSKENVETTFSIKLPINNPSTEILAKNCLTIENATTSNPEESLEELPTIWLKKFHQSILEGDVALMLKLVEQVRNQNEALADYLHNLIQSFKLREVLSLISKYDQPDK